MKNTFTLFALIICTNLIGQQLIPISEGSFIMGCTPGQNPCDDTDNVEHSVTLDAFYLSPYEVTQGQYTAIIGNNPSNNSGCNNCPVENITWYDAINYCNLLSEQANVTPVYYADASLLTVFTGSTGTVYWHTEEAGYRLPTEAEWEYAARSAGTDDFAYAGSNVATDVAAFNLPTSQEVGIYTPNSLGLYDMSGNISELVWDTYADYSSETVCNPLGPKPDILRVLRGGHYQSDNTAVLAKRATLNINTASNTAGFRICSNTDIISQTVDCVVNLTTPIDGASDVSAVTDIEWEASDDATGYLISLGTSPGGTDLLNETDIENTLIYQHTECFPENTTIYVNITAYNDTGNAMACPEFSFTIFDRDHTAPDGMVYVPCGVFEQGCTAEQSPCDTDEEPAHNVRIDGFFIGEYEVTQLEWEQTVTDYTPTYTSGESDSHAAYNVSWYDVMTYLNRKSSSQSLTPVYYTDAGFINVFDMLIGDGNTYVDVFQNPEANGFRLPTEAEWEYAARGGEDNANQTTYSGSNSIDAVGHYQSNSSLVIHAVGEKTPNALGLYDMSGNVWELCQDWYNETYYNELSPYTGNPIYTLTGTERIARGGSAFSPANLTRIANRDFVAPGVRSNQIGFRVIKTPLNVGELVCVPALVSPVNGATEVPVTTNIEWQAAPNATGYRISLGTTPNGTEIVNNQDLGDILSYNPDGCLPSNTTIYINITPYNDNGDATGCTEFSFTTADTDPVPPAGYVYVPCGSFEMGCTDEQNASGQCDADESPVHTVTIDGFFMSQYEVTQAEWAALVPDYTPNYTAGEGGTNPVYGVSWYDAVTYTNRLSIQEGFTPVYYFDESYTMVFDSLVGNPNIYVDIYWNASANGYRLPTEAEWEYAARGGGGTQSLYSGSDTADAVAWYGNTSGNSGGETHPVGEKQANALGLYDMSGNVWECCWDRYDNDYYDGGSVSNPTGPTGGSYRIRRGGSWASTASLLRVASRHYSLYPGFPGFRVNDFGFRLSRTP